MKILLLVVIIDAALLIHAYLTAVPMTEGEDDDTET